MQATCRLRIHKKESVVFAWSAHFAWEALQRVVLVKSSEDWRLLSHRNALYKLNDFAPGPFSMEMIANASEHTWRPMERTLGRRGFTWFSFLTSLHVSMTRACTLTCLCSTKSEAFFRQRFLPPRASCAEDFKFAQKLRKLNKVLLSNQTTQQPKRRHY